MLDRDGEFREFEPYERMIEDLSLERRKGVDEAISSRSFSSSKLLHIPIS